jgi:2-octaprenyl-6-methoxyphenol hydroxylase
MRRNSVKNFANRNDVIIVGGGPSGLTLAVALGAVGFSVLCVERKARHGFQKALRADGRTTALSFSSVSILEACGLWPRLLPHACPIFDIHVADRNSPFHLTFRHREVGDNPFGWIIENHIFHATLQKKVRELKNVRIITGSMKTIEADDDEARLILEDGRTLVSSLIIGADGRHSLSRKEMNVPTYGWNYDQIAIVCTIAHKKPHNNIAVEHFLPGGPLATLPMTKQRSSIVWTEKSESAKALMEMSENDFTECLQEKVQDWLGVICLTGPRFMHTLSLQHAKQYTAKRFALIGDAAHGIHPIAGQGFNLGMGDIGVLAEELTHVAHLGLDPGSADILRRYERQRKFANGNMVFMTDALDRLFSNAIPPIEALRRVGLGAVQKAGPLRRYFMRTAMGLGKTPEKERSSA